MIKLIGHMVLSGLLLVTSTGMTINMHFCQGHLYDLALNAPAHSCCEPDAGETACHHHHDMTKSHQCDDKSIRIESSQAGSPVTTACSNKEKNCSSSFPKLTRTSVPRAVSWATRCSHAGRIFASKSCALISSSLRCLPFFGKPLRRAALLDNPFL